MDKKTDDRYEYRDGQFVSQKVARVVQAIKDYCPELEVQFVPQSQRHDTTAAFRIIHHDSNREPYVVMHVKDESEFDARVLKELILGDQRNGKVTISAIEAAEAAAAAVARQAFIESIEEANEIAAAVLKSNKSTYKVNKNLVIKDYRRGNHASKPKHF